jgi:hypothetical protein
MIDKVIMVLQNYMDIQKFEPGSYNDTCHDGNLVIDIKVEEVTDMREEEDPLLITVPGIAEHEVSCTAVYT